MCQKLFTVSLLLLLYSSAYCYRITLFGTGTAKGELLWFTDYNTESVVFTLHLPRHEVSQAWGFGFGFSDRGTMANADILLIYRNNKKIYIMDSWTDGEGVLNRDLNQDYKLLFAETRRSTITVTFERPFITCDSHDYVLDNGTTNLITIFGLPTPTEYTNPMLPQTYKAVPLENYTSTLTPVQILKPNFSEDDEKKYKSFDLVAPKVVIPKDETTYWCSTHQLPDFEERVHGVGYESFVSEMSEGLIHHMEVFGCDVNDGDIPFYNGLCKPDQMPESVKRCNRVLAAWASGATVFLYPKEAGLTFYSATKSRFVRLEIHYNNQKNYEGIVDRSGIRFFYSEKLRKNEVGVMETGVIYTPDMAIPPNQARFVWSGVCPAECTRKGFPKGGINVFAVEQHAHLAGRRVWTSQFRGDHELPEISRDNHYSTWFEEIRQISPPRKVFPGDSLITSCEFSTKGRLTSTVGGLGIHQEMCVNYLFYYPATEVEVCKSSVAVDSLKAYFLLENMKQESFINLTTLSHSAANYNSLEWNDQAIQRLNFLYRNSPLRVFCLKPNGASWKGNWNNLLHSPFPGLQDDIESEC